MKVKKRDELMCRLFSVLRNTDTSTKRYGLYSLGESLISEYLDLEATEIEKGLAFLEIGLEYENRD